MNRAAVDNDLLRVARDRYHARAAKTWAFLTFAGIGALWYVVVFFRA
jgi:hypothetical protein